MKIRSPIARKRTRLEIIPLIDIMFFLLASFMMVSLQMQKVRTLKASLPTAHRLRDNAECVQQLRENRGRNQFATAQHQIAIGAGARRAQ